MLQELSAKVVKYMYLLDMSRTEAIKYVVSCTGFSDSLQEFFVNELNQLAE